LTREPDETSPQSGEAETSIAENARSLLAAIVASSNDAIIGKNLQGIIISWNEAASRMFGYTAEEMIGQPIYRLIPEELHHEEETILAKLRAGERVEHYETTRIKKSGDRFEVSITISPIKDNKGHIIAASKTARDISERKKIERLLIESEKLAATGRMAATIAHEINNPLDSLLNLIYLARTSASISKARVYLETAETELERVAHIARQTLGYYRGTGAPVEVNIQELMENAISLYQGKLRSHGIAVDCHFEPLQAVLADRGELMQVFSNVIANSIDAMPRGGVLRLRVAAAVHSGTNGAQIVVQDNGIGIRQENLTKVFEPFFTTKGHLGTGIGLWVTKQLIEKHRGNIALTSCTDPGNSGTTLSIFIPVTGSQDPDAV
jgi:PAS domain S-box-containing protein